MIQTDSNSSFLAINEIFYSIQGEASHTGLPCVFVRTMGCQMRCSYCDTAYAFTEGQKLSLDAIMGRVTSYPCKLVEITGGEPLLQKQGVIALMNRLFERGYTVLLETGGGFDLHELPDSCIKIVDVKCPDSGETEHMNWSFLKTAFPNTQLKFVLSSERDYVWAREWLTKNHAAISHYPIYFSPAEGAFDPALLAQKILEDALPVRLQLQLHKLLWGNKRGV